MELQVERRIQSASMCHSVLEARPSPTPETLHVLLLSSPTTNTPSRPAAVHASDAGATVKYAVVPYPQRIAEVLEVRRIARSTANQIAPDVSAVEMLDDRDLSASIGIAEIDGRIVGTMRMTLPLGETVLHHANRYLNPVVGLPPKAEYLELSRACVHPDYQGRGILWQLTAHMLIAARATGKPFLVAGANARMLPYWQRCGFRTTGTVYEIPTAPKVDHFLLVLDVEEVCAGRGIDPKLARALSALA